MAVSHVFSNAVADATGTMSIWFGATTATVAASDVVKPSDWNSAHNQVVTLSGNTVGVGVVTGTNIVFAGANNVTLSGVQGANAGTIHISAAAGGGGGSVNVSAGTTSNNLTNFVFADSNGVSFGLNGSTVTATVATNYLTTARASTDAIGLATAQSNVTWTANSAGLSLDARGYAGTGTTIGATNLSASATLNSNGLQLSLSAAAGGGGADGGNTIIAGTRTAGSNSGVLFDNSNGVTFGLNAVGGTVLTASVRTDYASSAHAHTENIGTATAQTNVTWTVNSNGLSLNAAGYAGTGFTSTTTAGTAVVGTHNTAGLSMGFPVFVTNAITTARASTDAVGLATAQTNVTWTVNSAGLSLNAAGYAGTGTTFNGANLSGSMTVNSNGVQLSMSAAAPGGGGLTQGSFYAQSNTTQSSSGTIALSSLNFAGAGIASVGITNGSVLISVPAGGGAGDGGVFAGVSNLGNTAGSTGVQTAGNLVLVGSNGITLSQSTAGGNATVTIQGAPYISMYENAKLYGTTAFNWLGVVSQSMFVPVSFAAPITIDYLRLAGSMQTNSSSAGTTANTTFSCSQAYSFNAAVFSQGTGTNYTRLESIYTSRGVMTNGWSLQANTAGSQYTVSMSVTYPKGTGTSSYSTSYATSQTRFDYSSNSITLFTGTRFIDVPFMTTLPAGVYYFAMGASSSSTTNGNNAFTRLQAIPSAIYCVSQVPNAAFIPLGVVSNSSYAQIQGMGSASSTTNFTNVPFSAISSFGGNGFPYFQAFASAINNIGT